MKEKPYLNFETKNTLTEYELDKSRASDLCSTVLDKRQKSATADDVLGIVSKPLPATLGWFVGGGNQTLQSQMNKYHLPAEPRRTRAVNNAMAYGIPMYPTPMQMDDSGTQ